MKRQSGFTLVEIAIVLVIIGLLLGGVLKGQELINSAKVKNFANDFRNVPLFIYGYQDKFKALPGDDSAVANHVATATQATTPAGLQGNGVIDGNWNTSTLTDESMLFWQHVRLAGLATGGTVVANNNTYWPTNAEGGRIGIESGSAHYILNTDGTTFLQGTYVVCSTGILGKFAKQLDTTMDDGATNTGSMRVVNTGHTRGQQALAIANVDDATSYTVCMGL
ncbi:MAG: prepilin-type N-terminal cleavage/methylation domain-containing protein [Rhodocyclaceae bacterium]|jgi:prepilin-type N-terminal cleavage/methylation domain-containing protein|nr:prepilin-type N-terminal cleavage/methylation domain-containing protein [Rhodocyclaceae bacterium]